MRINGAFLIGFAETIAICHKVCVIMLSDCHMLSDGHYGQQQSIHVCQVTVIICSVTVIMLSDSQYAK